MKSVRNKRTGKLSLSGWLQWLWWKPAWSMWMSCTKYFKMFHMEILLNFCLIGSEISIWYLKIDQWHQPLRNLPPSEAFYSITGGTHGLIFEWNNQMTLWLESACQWLVNTQYCVLVDLIIHLQVPHIILYCKTKQTKKNKNKTKSGNILAAGAQKKYSKTTENNNLLKI